MQKLLLIEDDPVLGRGLMVSLELEGYGVRWERDLAHGFAALKESAPDMVVLDLGLPDGSGLEILKSLRDDRSEIPVLVLTAQTDEDSVVAGLQAGARDYVRKPFGNRELHARIRAALRAPAAGAEPSRHLRFEELVVDLDARQGTYAGKPIELSRREFDVLAHFIRHADSVVTREALIQALDKQSEIYDRTVDSHVSHVRARLKAAGVRNVQISSVYGVGYRLEKK